MLSVVVCILACVAYSDGGFFQQKPRAEIPSPFLVNSDILAAQLLPRGISYSVKAVPEKDVSYSISYTDYLYLKQHKVEGHDSPYNPDPTEYGSVISNHNGKQHRHHGKHDFPCSDILLKRSPETNSIKGYNNPLVSIPVEPVVQKHVYFHVPPPGFEDLPAPARLLTQPRKNLNIVYIKAPSYDHTYLQQLHQSHQEPIEDKTLIYVLSKQEVPPIPVVLPPKPTSVPEVFFVKYRHPNEITMSVENELPLPNLLHKFSPVLERRNEGDHDP